MRHYVFLSLLNFISAYPALNEVVFGPNAATLQPVRFEIAPGVESVLSLEPSRKFRSGLPLNHARPGGLFQIGVAPGRPETTTGNLIGPGSGSGSGSDEVIIVDTFPIDGSGGSEIGSGNGSFGIFFPDDFGTTPRPTAEGKCNITNGEIYFQNACHRLLRQGPCDDGEWVVISKEGLPQCANRQCPSDQLWFNKRCVNIDAFSVCGQNEIIYVDYSGNAYCDCQQEFVYDSDLRQCLAEHERGSCSFGEHLQIVNGEVKCVNNICQREDLIYDPNKKRCFKKLFKGRCEKSVSSLITYDDGTAKCFSIENRNIFEVPALSSCPAGSKRDYFGNCRTIFRINSDNPFSYRVPTQYTSRYSACPQNYTKFPDGSCKKVNDLFT